MDNTPYLILVGILILFAAERAKRQCSWGVIVILGICACTFFLACLSYFLENIKYVEALFGMQ